MLCSSWVGEWAAWGAGRSVHKGECLFSPPSQHRTNATPHTTLCLLQFHAGGAEPFWRLLSKDNPLCSGAACQTGAPADFSFAAISAGKKGNPLCRWLAGWDLLGTCLWPV